MNYTKRRALRHRMMRRVVIRSHIQNVFASFGECTDDLMAAIGMVIMVFVLFPILIRIGGFVP